MAVSVAAVYPRDLVADLELCLAAFAQHHTEVSSHVSLAQKRYSKFKLQSAASTECISISHHCRVEKSKVEPS